MTIVLVFGIALVLHGLAIVLSVCRAAARADEAMVAWLRERRRLNTSGAADWSRILQ